MKKEENLETLRKRAKLVAKHKKSLSETQNLDFFLQKSNENFKIFKDINPPKDFLHLITNRNQQTNSFILNQDIKNYPQTTKNVANMQGINNYFTVSNEINNLQEKLPSKEKKAFSKQIIIDDPNDIVTEEKNYNYVLPRPNTVKKK